jgi:alpha-glucosidase (family GH31 glycosyl hydrolase)
MNHPLLRVSTFIRNIFITFLLFITSAGFSQIAWLEPSNPPVDAEIKLYYNASAGNKALAGQTGDIYLHTGVITNKSIDGHDWKYVVGNWGKPDQKVLMKRESADLYSFSLKINDFYKLNPEDVAQQLAFVFRNEDGTLVGKTLQNEDITIPVNGYIPPVKENTRIPNPPRKLMRVESVTDGWNLFTDHGLVMLRSMNPRMVGVTFSPDGKPFADTSHSVILKPGIVVRKTSVLPQGQLLESGELSIFAHNYPFRLSFIYQGDTILSEEEGFFENSDNRGVRFKLRENEAIFGAGERALAMNRRGNRFVLYNRPFYGYEFGASMLNYSMPLTFSSDKYAVLFDNPQKGYVDIGKTEPQIQEWGTIGGTLRYFVVAGPNWPSVSADYTELTGRQSLPPRWALGNLQSRMAYRNQAETDSIVNLMLARKFPMDAIILDFYWFGDSIQGHLGKLDWYKKAWPDPEGMISSFRSKGVKTILITEPYVIDTVANHKIAADKGVFVTDSLGNPYIDKQFYFGAGSLIDIFKPEAKDWFWSKYQKQIEKGVAGWWGDLGEPESHPTDIYHVTGKADEVHNIYGHYWDKMLYDKYKQHYPDTRLFHLQRSGFAGSQRYSAYPWTGDVSRSWGGLKAQLPLLLTMSISGLGYIHSDAGGFAQGVKDEELYTRWLQFAVFTPILRPHGSTIPSEPVYWSEKTQDIVRKYMELRYALLPYNYTLAWQNATSGKPLMAPLFYYYPEDPDAYLPENQYMWGDQMMIAAITQKGLDSIPIYFPEGNWVDFHSNITYAGNQWVMYKLSIENLPVFVKAGSFIPMIRPIRSTDYYEADEYIVKYYPEGSSQFVQYEDDGKSSFSLEKKQFELIRYSAEKTGLVTTLQLSAEGSWDGKPLLRNMSFEIKRSNKPMKVIINGKDIIASKVLKPGVSNYKFVDGWLKLNFTWSGEPVKIEIIEPKNLK